MAKKISLTIQEVVYDFERLVRYDERLYASFNNKMIYGEEIEGVYRSLEEMISRYMPDYKENIPSQYFSDDASTYEKASILYQLLYGRFKEIFYQLI